MKTQFVYTFKTRNAVLNHLRALAQLATGVSGRNFTLSDFLQDYPYLMDYLRLVRRYRSQNLYIVIRECGFESSVSFPLIRNRISAFSDVIASYKVSYLDRNYELREIEL